jgi:hypothetical protein
MADIEVENILREIRERVYAEQQASTATRLTDSNGGAASRENGELQSGDLARLESYLTTTARSWDRLPPVVSNRSGTTARIELWLKRHLKRATRWYAWEQVNFNAAVHHALGDIVQLLSANQKTVENLRKQLRAESENRRVDQQQQSEKLCSAISLFRSEIINELREAAVRLQEEQRVSYKQLALEGSEAAVLEDRARRKTEVLLEQLQRRVEQLEARK